MNPVKNILGIRKDRRSKNDKPWLKRYDNELSSYVWVKDNILVYEPFSRKDYMRIFKHADSLKPNDKFLVFYGDKNQMYTKGFISRFDANNFVRLFKLKR